MANKAIIAKKEEIVNVIPMPQRRLSYAEAINKLHAHKQNQMKSAIVLTSSNLS